MKTTSSLFLLPLIEGLIQSLGRELLEYGEMLALLDEERNSIPTGSPNDVFRSVTALDDQQLVIHSVRQQRELHQKKVASALERPSNASLNELISLLPASHQLPVTTLVRQINEALARVQTSARQNRLLLNQSLERLGDLIDSVEVLQDAV